MAHNADGHQTAAHFELTKMQLITGLNSVAESMRACANLAESFSKLVNTVSLDGNGITIANGHIAPAPAARSRKRKANLTPEEEALLPEPKKRREKKEKDPNAPKRPPSSYLLFQNEIRKQISEQNPNMPNNEVLKHISAKWKQMTPDERESYETRAKSKKADYAAAKAAYDVTLGIVPKTSPALADVPAAAAPSSPVITAKPAKSKVAPVVAPAATSDESESSEPDSEIEHEKASTAAESSDEEEVDDDDDDDEEEVAPPQPAPKKSAPKHKAAPPPPPAAKEKKTRKAKA